MKRMLRALYTAPLLVVLIAGTGAAAPSGEEICPKSGKPTWQCCGRKASPSPPCCQRTRCHDNHRAGAEARS